ncbi:MAG: hydrogenase small subunit [Syntrophobacteraceae bacterium]
MKVTRRDFMRYCISSAAVLGLETSVLGRLEKALAAGGGPPIIWLAAANCTGCTVSLANLVSSSHPTDVADLLIGTINLAYHPNLMAAAGDTAVQALRKASAGPFVLAVEGGIPTAFGGHTCMLWTEDGKEITALQAVRDLAPRAAAVLSIGTCASFGGIPGAAPNPTAIKTVKAASGVNTINIPGCPTHPDWIVWTIAQLLAGKTPALDTSRRPSALFSKTVHSQCPRQTRDWARRHGVKDLCLNNLGCKGRITRGDCPSRLWNNKTNWCVGANSICLGCTQTGFPDKFSPFYSSIGATPAGHDQTSSSCTDCHAENGEPGGGGTLPDNHVPTNGQSCSSCHGTTPGATPPGHPSVGNDSCLSCHDGGSNPGDLPSGHPSIGSQSCSSCHDD